jgi:hypothetical protein
MVNVLIPNTTPGAELLTAWRDHHIHSAHARTSLLRLGSRVGHYYCFQLLYDTCACAASVASRGVLSKVNLAKYKAPRLQVHVYRVRGIYIRAQRSAQPGNVQGSLSLIPVNMSS